MNMKTMLTTFCALVVMACASQAAVIYQHTYELGEPGTILTNRPQDSVITGTSHFGNGWGGAIGIGTTGVAAPNSTAYGIFNGAGAYGANFTSLADNNFAVEMWVRTATPGQGNNEFFVTGNSGTRLAFSVVGGNWGANTGANWIGGASGAGQAILADTWTHLAVIRDTGVSTLYINGIAQSGTQTALPDHNANGHIGVQSGGQASYVGDIDDVRMFTFDPATDNAVAALNVPEPATMTLLALGGIAMLRRRRNHA